MAPKTNKEKPDDSEEEIKARMEQALKRALSMPHKTDREVAEGKRRSRKSKDKS